MIFPPSALREANPGLWAILFLGMNPKALMLAVIGATIICAGRGI